MGCVCVEAQGLMYDVYICVLPKQEKEVPDISPIPWFQHFIYACGLQPKCLSHVFVFLSLVVKNKTLTIENLAKRRKVEDETCLVCSEPLPVLHVFF